MTAAEGALISRGTVGGVDPPTISAMENHAAFAAGLAKLRGNPTSVCKFILFDQLYLYVNRQLTSSINLIKARPRVDSEDVISLTASYDGQPPSHDPEMDSFVMMLQLEEESKMGKSKRVSDTASSNQTKKKKLTKKEQNAEAVAKKVKEQQDLAKHAAASNQVHRPHADHHQTLDSMFGQITKSSTILDKTLMHLVQLAEKWC
jgi:hypothetical protein